MQVGTIDRYMQQLSASLSVQREYTATTMPRRRSYDELINTALCLVWLQRC